MQGKIVEVFPRLLIGAILILQGCSDPVEPAVPVQEQVKLNVVDRPISLKDLTTGVVYDTKTMPKPEFKFEGDRRFKYQYFGGLRSTTIKVTDKNIIYDIDIDLGMSAESALNEIEAKLTQDNGRQVKFICSVESESLEMLGIKDSRIESKTCTVVGRSQELVVKIQKPTGTAAVTRIDLNRGRIRLKDPSIEAAIRKEKQEKVSRDAAAAEQKRKSDI